MGVDISDIAVKHQTTLKEQSGFTFSVDGFNIIYQFLSSIRQPDGTPLMDSEGRITSHISGMFYRTINLLDNGIKPVFVLDGKPSPLKNRTLHERRLVKEKAKEELKIAREEHDEEKIRSYSARISYITDQVVEDVKELLDYMGVPWVQAPSEGEAQASYMSRADLVNGVISQDYDCLLFGAKRVYRNFAIYGRRKLPGRSIYVNVSPEFVELEETLEKNDITLEQLIDIGIMVGTDFNKGLRRVGAKTGLNLIRKHGNIKKILEERGEYIENLDEIREFFLHPPVTDEMDIKFRKPDSEKLIGFLCDNHDFSRNRVEPYIETLDRTFGQSSQSNLDVFF